jgi:flagellar biosynthesis protein FlhF
MRLKTFTAATTAEAMAAIRAALGEDAVIVSTAQAGDGSGAVLVTAAVDQPPMPDLPSDVAELPRTAGDAQATLRHALMFHGVPARLAGALSREKRAAETADAVLGLAAALDARFRFKPLGETAKLLLIGPPGGGKTVTAAKLAARAVLHGKTAALATADTRRAGGVDQLAAFARILGCPFIEAEDDAALAAAAKTAEADLFVADTYATNPFDDDDIEALSQTIARVGAEPVLVVGAGGDGMEMADIGGVYGDIGCARLIATRIDAARRLGGLLACAEGGGLAFSDVGVGPQAADGLATITPVALARLLLPDTEDIAQGGSAAPPHPPHPEVAE